MSGLDFLALVLQSSTVLIWMLFQVLFSLFLIVYERLVQLTLSWSLCSTGFFWKVENNVLVLFFVWILQFVFSLKPMFSECPSFFLLFVYNDGALILHRHVVALPVWVTMSWPTKSTYKLNMSGLDFLALVLQSSNSFDMNTFSSFV